MSERVRFFIDGQKKLAKPFRYRASGLDNIFLLNGVIIKETPYGPMVTIKDINNLHHAIGLHIVEKTGLMTGPEFRFLRKQLGLTQAELGKRLRVSDQTIANYEKGKTRLGPADPMLRGFYLLNILPEQTKIEVLKTMSSNISKHKIAKLPDVSRRRIVLHWHEGAQAA